MSDDLRKLIQTKDVTEKDIEKLAVTQGSILMIHDGLLKALQGDTSLSEVFKAAE